MQIVANLITVDIVYIVIIVFFIAIRFFKINSFVLASIVGYTISFIASLVLFPPGCMNYYGTQIAMGFPLEIIGEMFDYYILGPLFFKFEIREEHFFASIFLYGILQYYLIGIVIQKILNKKTKWGNNSITPRPVKNIITVFLVVVSIATVLTCIYYIDDRSSRIMEGVNNFKRETMFNDKNMGEVTQITSLLMNNKLEVLAIVGRKSSAFITPDNEVIKNVIYSGKDTYDMRLLETAGGEGYGFFSRSVPATYDLMED
jgi:hypothetical protein